MGFNLAWLEVIEAKGLLPVSNPAPPLDISEKDFQAAVIALATRNGWEYWHCYDSRKSRDGWPDLAFWRDRFFLCELKKESGRLTKEQQATIDGLRAAGACVYIFRPSDWPRILEALTT